ncbi:universal stress protein [Mesorhizobium australicum]|uniref:Nucleotide-binding universal stress protein, UspA family n=1 Tax=Mesorhizobium australicum TaxID=536018 RepID=A0A1X7PXZ2_9HYPH|nr:universal stress protein [Mesorhizobium australicum]SMH56665.1 Nucleotide-binding universal stress protein, UspA family [Mesorhizobium australicum]
MKKTALLPLVTYPEPLPGEALAASVEFASKAGFDLFALSLEADFPDVANALSRLLLDVPEMIRRAEAQSRMGGEALLKAVATLATQHGVESEAGRRRSAQELAGDAAAEEARYFDLSVVPMPKVGEQGRAIAEAIVFGSGRPTILVPEALVVRGLRRAVVAWDGSRVAARAVNDMLSLFGGMDQVTIVSVLNEKPLPADDLGDRLAAHLIKRGVPARALAVELEDQPIGATLQDFAIQDGAGLLAMGAYGHSRLREFVLGGATRTILEDVRLPVLMSH